MNPYLLLLIGFLSGASTAIVIITLRHERLMKSRDKGAFGESGYE